MHRGITEALRALCACAVAALMIYAPHALPEYVARDEYMEFFEIKQSEWTGVLTVWNVYLPEQRLPQEVIDKAKKKFCSQNIGVYVEHSTLTAQQAKARSEETAPDVCIFPVSVAMGTPELEFLARLPEAEAAAADFEFDVDGKAQEQEYAHFCICLNKTDEKRLKYTIEFASVIAKTAADVLK